MTARTAAHTNIAAANANRAGPLSDQPLTSAEPTEFASQLRTIHTPIHEEVRPGAPMSERARRSGDSGLWNGWPGA